METNKNIVNKKILIVLTIVLVAGLGFWYKDKYKILPPISNNQAEDASGQNEQNKDEINTTSTIVDIIEKPKIETPKDVAWQLFQKYLDYNKNRDLEGVKSVVYKIAPICNDPSKKVDCEKRMDQAYYYGSELKKDNFTNVWTDSKQTILSSDFKIEQNTETISRVRSIIFFVKVNNELKLLSFSPFKGSVSQKGAASNEELNDRIKIYTEDKDQDGVSDYTEQCLGVEEGQTCVKTDPKLRDTDGDGYWDGVDDLMNK